MDRKHDFLPYALPDIGEEEIQEVIDAIKSGWVTSGPKVKQFEHDFTNFIGSNVESISVNSATSGLHLVLEALGIGTGDEVIVPVYTFTATAEVVCHLGATPVFVDVLEDTFNIDKDSFRSAITDRTKAVIPVHFAGLSCDMDSIFSIAKQYGLYVIEDAAHALPSTYNGDIIGSLESDATVFSFYANKTMTTGEGGMIVTRNIKIAERCKIMRLHGISRDAFDRYVSKSPDWFYEVVAPGYKYNMNDIAAAIGIHQLRKLKSFQKKRENYARIYDEELKALPIITPQKAPECELHARHIYPIRLFSDLKITRDVLISRLAKSGIGCSVHFIPLHIHPFWKKTCQLSSEDFPVSQSIYESVLSIPLYTRMTEDDVYRVVKTLSEVILNG